MAPEVILCKRVPLEQATKSDIYSLGVVMLALLSGKDPRKMYEVDVKDPFQLHSHVVSGAKPQITVSHLITPEIKALILRCLDSNFVTRPTSREALEEFSSILLSMIPDDDAKTVWTLASGRETFKAQMKTKTVVQCLLSHLPFSAKQLEFEAGSKVNIQPKALARLVQQILSPKSDYVKFTRWAAFSKAFGPFCTEDGHPLIYNRLFRFVESRLFMGIDVLLSESEERSSTPTSLCSSSSTSSSASSSTGQRSQLGSHKLPKAFVEYSSKKDKFFLCVFNFDSGQYGSIELQPDPKSWNPLIFKALQSSSLNGSANNNNNTTTNTNTTNNYNTPTTTTNNSNTLSSSHEDLSPDWMIQQQPPPLSLYSLLFPSGRHKRSLSRNQR